MTEPRFDLVEPPGVAAHAASRLSVTHSIGSLPGESDAVQEFKHAPIPLRLYRSVTLRRCAARRRRDRSPPFVENESNANTDATTYPLLGRTYFVELRYASR